MQQKKKHLNRGRGRKEGITTKVTRYNLLNQGGRKKEKGDFKPLKGKGAKSPEEGPCTRPPAERRTISSRKRGVERFQA